MSILLEPPASQRNVRPPAGDDTDERLIAGIKTQDPDALAALYERYACFVRSIAMDVVHDGAESDDLLNNVFLEVWTKASAYDHRKGKVLGWLVTLARRRSIDRLRKKEAYVRMSDRLLAMTGTDAPASARQVTVEVEHADMRQRLEGALAALPPVQRQVVEMAHCLGMSQREIALATRTPLGTVKTRIELGMRKLAKSLAGFEDLL